MNLVEIFEKEQIKQKIPQIGPGDKIKVYQKIKEGGKTRTQSFEGIIIRARVMKTARANFTVRKIASGVGVEKTFFIHSPNITKIKTLKKGKVRRAKLYYIRERQGKAARLKEKEGELTEWEIVEPVEEKTKVKEEEGKIKKKVKEEKVEKKEKLKKEGKRSEDEKEEKESKKEKSKKDEKENKEEINKSSAKIEKDKKKKKS